MLNKFVSYIVPLLIIFIIICGIKEKKDVFKLFVDGVLEGLKIVYSIFPYILAITIAMYVLRDTGALNVLLTPLKPVLSFFNIPDDIIPLCIMRPLSGGASTSIVMDIFKNNGPDSISGKMASVIMGATETTLYTVTILLGAVGIKKARGIIIAGIIADVCAMIVGVTLVNVGIL